MKRPWVPCNCGFCANPVRGCLVAAVVTLSMIAAGAVVSWMLSR